MSPSSEPPTAGRSAGPRGPSERVHLDRMNQGLSRISFTADQDIVGYLERACALLRCRRSNVGPLIGRALKLLLREIDPELRFGKAVPPRRRRRTDRRARRVPVRVRIAVWKRDGGQCTFQDAEERRCEARRGLEFDHIRPWASGGASDDPDNIRLRCRAHNLAAARDWFGRDRIDAAIALERAGRAATSRPAPP